MRVYVLVMILFWLSCYNLWQINEEINVIECDNWN